MASSDGGSFWPRFGVVGGWYCRSDACVETPLPKGLAHKISGLSILRAMDACCVAHQQADWYTLVLDCGSHNDHAIPGLPCILFAPDHKHTCTDGDSFDQCLLT